MCSVWVLSGHFPQRWYCGLCEICPECIHPSCHMSSDIDLRTLHMNPFWHCDHLSQLKKKKKDVVRLDVGCSPPLPHGKETIYFFDWQKGRKPKYILIHKWVQLFIQVLLMVHLQNWTLKYQEIGNSINIDALVIYWTVLCIIYMNANTGDFFLDVLFFFYKIKKSWPISWLLLFSSNKLY